MTSPKKNTKPHATTASQLTNEGDETMKTTTKSHATNDANHATHEEETTMKTTKTSHAHASLAPTIEVASTAAAAQPPNAPTPATLGYIQACSTILDQLEAAFPQGGTLTAKDKQRRAKARKGSERFTPQLVALARQHGVNLALVPLDAISSASAEATALVPLQKRIEGFATKAASRMFALQSTSWSGSAKLYSVLKRLSKDDGDIETGLAPIEQFFNHRHPSVAKEHPKTKKGKAALAAEKAAQAAATAATTAPAVTAVATPVTTPVETPATTATSVAHS